MASRHGVSSPEEVGRGRFSVSQSAGSGSQMATEEVLQFERIRDGIWSERLQREDGPAWRDARGSASLSLEAVKLPPGWHW